MKHVNKKIWIAFALAGTGLLQTGCKKTFLDQQPYNNQIQVSQYFQTFDQCNTSVQVAYQYVLFNDWWQRQNGRFLFGEAATDNAWIGNTYQASHATWDACAWYTLDASNDRIEGHWVMTYKAIGIFNSTIEGIQGSAAVDDATKKKLIGELRFLRAYMYFDLVRNFGGVPLVTKTLSPSTRIPRSTDKEIYAFVINELKDVAPLLSQKSQYGAPDKFRASKGAALAMLAKAYLYTEDWANAETTAKQCMTLGDYTLETSFGNLWNYNYKNGAESVFEIQFNSQQTPSGIPDNKYITPMNSTADGGWGYISVTSDLENAFKSEADSIRLQWTINRHGVAVAGETSRIFDGRPSQSKSARFSRKRYVPVAQRPSNGRFGFNDLLIRYAEVLLIHAEACAMQDKAPDALASLKLIRDRVSLPTDLTLKGQALIDAVRKERRLELALEGERLYDIRRWKGTDGKPLINSIFGPNGSFVRYNTIVSTDVYEKSNTAEPQDKGKNFQPGKHNLWPIPAVEIAASEGVVTQNPGY